MIATNKINHSLESSVSTRHAKVIEKTYRNNIESDYTEKLRDLGKEFKYDNDRDYYWSDPENSLLYGTPLYEVSSPTQKLALNHLCWVGSYNYTAASEASTRIYNLITAGVFRKVGGYDTLCDELEFETKQESDHIRTFQRIGYKSKMAIVGKTTLGNSLHDKKEDSKWLSTLPQPVQKFFVFNKRIVPFSVYTDKVLKVIAKNMLGNNQKYYSEYLKDLETKNEPIPAGTDGFVGKIAPRHLLRFFTIHWGMSPFMACQYYSARYIANAILKNHEYPYVRHYRILERQSNYIPTPTAVSYYHLLDEAFHTTVSQTIARDMYNDFPKPSAYEKYMAGLIIYLTQKNSLGGLSAILPNHFVTDNLIVMLFCYKLLKSPLFGMETQEALQWMEKCFTQEHEGFHVALRHHKNLLESMCRFFGQLDYQWKINREMGIMVAGGSIEKAIQSNIKTFKKFCESVTSNQ